MSSTEMTFESRFLAKFRGVKDFPDPLPLQKKTVTINCNYSNGDKNNNNKSSNNNTVKNVKIEKKGDDKNGIIKRRKSFTEKLFKNASGGTLRLTGINASKLRDMFFGDKFANKESNSDNVFCNDLEVGSEEIYSSPSSLPPNIGCLPEYENVDYFIPVSTSSSIISLPKHNGLKSPNASKFRTFRRSESPYGTILKEKLNRSRLQLQESSYSDADSIYSSSPFSYTVPLSSSLNSPIINSFTTSPVITSKKEPDSSSTKSSSKSPLFKIENGLRETFNYGKLKTKKIKQSESFINYLTTEPNSCVYEVVKSRDSFSSFSSDSSIENEITDLENRIPSNVIHNHLQNELKLKMCELKRKSDSSLPRISVSHCNRPDTKEVKDYVTNINTEDELKKGKASICKHSSDANQTIRTNGKFKPIYLGFENGNSSEQTHSAQNQSHILSHNSRNLELNLSNPIQKGFKKEYPVKNIFPKPEVNRTQKFFSAENLSKSDGSHYESTGVNLTNSSKTLNNFHKELMQKYTTLKSRTTNLSKNEFIESEKLKNESKFCLGNKPVPGKPSISPKPKLTRKPDVYLCPLYARLSDINDSDESETTKQTSNRPEKPFKPKHLLEIDQGKAKLQNIEINNNSIIIPDQSPRKNEINFSPLKKREKLDVHHLSNLNLRQNINKFNNIYSNIEESMSSHISLTNLSSIKKSDSYNTLKVKDLVATFNKCTVPSNRILTKDSSSYLPKETTRFSPKKSLSEYNLTYVKRRSSFKS